MVPPRSGIAYPPASNPAWFSGLGDLAAFWQPLLSLAAALLTGFVVGQLFGKRPHLDQIRGLVAGAGYLGLREAEEASIAIEVEENSPKQDSTRWR